jgi:hypothetical protein
LWNRAFFSRSLQRRVTSRHAAGRETPTRHSGPLGVCQVFADLQCTRTRAHEDPPLARISALTRQSIADESARVGAASTRQLHTHLPSASRQCDPAATGARLSAPRRCFGLRSVRRSGHSTQTRQRDRCGASPACSASASDSRSARRQRRPREAPRSRCPSPGGGSACSSAVASKV